MAEIIGRQDEIKVLTSLLGTDKSTFTAVYGRRRVGKTFLIRNIYENQLTFHITGLGNVDMSHQLINFHAALTHYFPDCEDLPIATTWFQAFQYLIKALDGLPKTS